MIWKPFFTEMFLHPKEKWMHTILLEFNSLGINTGCLKLLSFLKKSYTPTICFVYLLHGWFVLVEGQGRMLEYREILSYDATREHKASTLQVSWKQLLEWGFFIWRIISSKQGKLSCYQVGIMCAKIFVIFYKTRERTRRMFDIGIHRLSNFIFIDKETHGEYTHAGGKTKAITNH